MPASNIIRQSVKTMGLLKRPLGHLVPGWNLAKTISGAAKGISDALPRNRALKKLKRSFFAGKKFYGKDLRKGMMEFSNVLDDQAGRNALQEWLRVTGASSGRTIKNVPNKIRAFGDEVADLFYKTTKYDFSKATADELISATLNRHNASLKSNIATSYARDVIFQGSKARAYNALKQANLSKNLLTGPTLGSNMAVIALPTLTSTTSTIATMKAMKRRTESIYHGYHGYKGG